MNTEHDEKKMKTVHERDIDNLLKKLSLTEDFHSGKIKCKFCKNTITKENVYSLIHESGAVNFVCDKAECISEFMLHMESKKKDLQE